MTGQKKCPPHSRWTTIIVEMTRFFSAALISAALSVSVLALLISPAGAVDFGPPWVTVIEKGQVLVFDRLEDARLKNRESFPFLGSLREWEEEIVPDLVYKKGSRDFQVPAPRHYGDKAVRAFPFKYFTPSGGRLVFLSFGLLPTEGKAGVGDDDFNGVFAVLDPSQGSIRTEIPGVYKVHGAGRGTLVMEPQLAVAGRYAFFGRSSRLVAFDLDSGKELWESAGSLGWQPALRGAWLRGNALYVKSRGGLARYEPEAGSLIWETRKVKNWISNLELGPEQRLYVVSYDAP
ncbi:MAG: PQQ-binding-like beta-propeller repeat protein [Candidatus Eremiobacteraeota bacterium]|nr:PQQ-binding-like beta-propeller repeat protein [Candidatus Eremiobacteraeota bacterium]